MADLDLVWKELISRLKQAKESVTGKATALCPAHNEKNPSSGDIILCPEIINQEAKVFGLPSKLRWAHMIIHSMLHLQGYTHNVTRNRLKMEKLEMKLLADMNYGNPYVRS